MKNKMLLSFLLSILSSFGFAGIENYKSDFTVYFDTGNAFDVSIRGDSLMWKGMAGEDKGTEQTVKIKHVSLAKNVEVFQWKEKRGYFVTFVVDTLNKKAITSTKNDKNQDWLVEGKITYLK